MWEGIVRMLRLHEELTRDITATPQKLICLFDHTARIENFDCLSLGVSYDCAIPLVIDAIKADCHKERMALLMSRLSTMNDSGGVWMCVVP